jgi:tRNA A-37 threonylcarbamoyl transferase component Bud32
MTRAPRDDRRVEIGTRVAERFTIVARAGSGGMSTVFRARDEERDEDVALKLLHENADGSRFEREATLLAKIRHAGVVGYVAHGRAAGGGRFVAFDWVDGETLATRLERAPMADAAALRIVARAAETIGDLHAMRIIHRDIKPSNLMLRAGSDEDVVVMDFGIARADTSTMVTATNVFLGTPSYVAPEQAYGAIDLDARVDVYALGCVLFECLTRRRAFDGPDLFSVLAKVAVQPAPKLAAFRPELPEKLAALVERVLAKKKNERPTDGAALAQEILALVPIVEQRSRFSTAAPIAMRREHTRVRSIVAAAGVAADAAQVRAIASQHGGDVALLIDGSAAVTWHDRGPTEQAVTAARCALAIARDVAGATVAVATGRGAISEGAVLGAVIDRAVTLIATARGDQNRRVRIDAETVALLGARVDVERTSDGAWLRPFRTTGATTSRMILGRTTTCVGRDAEIEVLYSSFLSTRDDGVARAVLVTAPPGVGKTRLAEELLTRLVTSKEPPRARIVRCESQRAAALCS